MSKKLVIIGASGHGKVVADIALKTVMRLSVFWTITMQSRRLRDSRFSEAYRMS